MPDSGLPDDVDLFIDRHIRSIEHLEVLLALASRPAMLWSPRSVFEAVQSSEASVRARLDELTSEGLCQREGDQYRFSPATEGVRVTVESLARAYKERSIRVIQAVYSERRRAVQELSDAFRFRRKAKDG